MNSLRLFLVTIFFGFFLMLSLESRADFGEIDILVRESVEAYFKEDGRSVDLQRFNYVGNPILNQDTLVIHSSVWAEQRMIEPYWGWHECTTELVVLQRGKYTDKGSECFFEFD